MDMKSGLYKALALCITFCGCSSSYLVVPRPAKNEYSYQELTSEFAGKNAVIELRNGQEISAGIFW